MAKHTPGPWTYAIDDEYDAEVFVDDNLPGRAVIAEVATQPEREANARLIAKAPELLTSLKALVEETIAKDNPGDYGVSSSADVMTEARALIAEIEGGRVSRRRARR